VYLYQAVDPTGATIDFPLLAKRDAAAAERFGESQKVDLVGLSGMSAGGLCAMMAGYGLLPKKSRKGSRMIARQSTGGSFICRSFLGSYRWR
jgi:hypothetical protein